MVKVFCQLFFFLSQNRKTKGGKLWLRPRNLLFVAIATMTWRALSCSLFPYILIEIRLNLHMSVCYQEGQGVLLTKEKEMH